jgi:hypothetical protein
MACEQNCDVEVTLKHGLAMINETSKNMQLCGRNLLQNLQ